MNMKGLILSGGHGTRLRPITYTSAKQLVPVANKPVLFYGIEALRDAGIKEIGIIVGHTRAEIEAAVGNGEKFGVNITYIPQDAPLGLAHAVKISEPFIGKSPFIMYLGDNLVMDGVKAVVEDFINAKANAQILLAKVPNPQSFGVAELEDGKIIRLEEKPKNPKSDLAVVGVYLYDHHIFDACRAIKPSPRGELEITHAIQWLIDQRFNVRSSIISGWWKDTGKLEDMLEANRMLTDRLETKIDGEMDSKCQVDFRVVLEKGAKLINSKVRGPAIIGAGTIVENSFIGPFTSIGPNCQVRNCEIEHSIILEGSQLEDVPARVQDSLLGKGVKVTKHHYKAYQFVLGDNSEVRI